jgi:hypothetical protein
MHSPSYDHPQTRRLTTPKAPTGAQSCSELFPNSIEEAFETLAARRAQTGGISDQGIAPLENCSEPPPIIVGDTFKNSEAGDHSHQRHGLPLSSAVKAAGFTGLGINGRMLACQSADRWQSQSKEGFREVIAKHTLRAAFQSLLMKHFPSVWSTKPVLGKQKKQPVGDVPKAQQTEERYDPGVVYREVMPASECATVGGASNRKSQDGVDNRRNERESTFQTIVDSDRPSEHGDARPLETSSPNLASMQSQAEKQSDTVSLHLDPVVQSGLPIKSSAQPNWNNTEQTLEPVETRTSAECTASTANGACNAEQKPLSPSSSKAAPFSYLGNDTSLETGSETQSVADRRTRQPGNGSQESASERARFLGFARESLQRLGLPQLGEEEVLGVWDAILSYKVSLE